MMRGRSPRPTRRRKCPRQAKGRSTLQRRLSRRRCRPSGRGGLPRWRRWAQSNSRPRRARRLRRGAASQAWSSLTRSGFWRGRPGPRRGTAMVSRVGSSHVTSAGDAESTRLPRGLPGPSTTTLHCGPFPRVVVPTCAPRFARGHSGRRRRLQPHCAGLGPHVGRERPARPSARRLARPRPAGAARRDWGRDTAGGNPATVPRGAPSTRALRNQADGAWVGDLPVATAWAWATGAHCCPPGHRSVRNRVGSSRSLLVRAFSTAGVPRADASHIMSDETASRKKHKNARHEMKIWCSGAVLGRVEMPASGGPAH